ncbi:MAG: hypothetical protein NWE98_03950 [Candidatus Bathyarchaeota archaeon]|nr:hypothetical protein [Candidatus Bathyarchaeota archaeon]
MEYVNGHRFDSIFLHYLINESHKSKDILNSFGVALGEFHSLTLENLPQSSFPLTPSQLKKEVILLSENLEQKEIINKNLLHRILDFTETAQVSDKIFVTVTLHGELYFTHVFVLSDKFVLFDLHNILRGPSYFDLAMFALSIRVSLAFSAFSTRKFDPLLCSFLMGYYKNHCEKKIFESIKVAEIYVALREIMSLCYLKKIPLIVRLQNALKIQRLRHVIDQSVKADI